MKRADIERAAAKTGIALDPETVVDVTGQDPILKTPLHLGEGASAVLALLGQESNRIWTARGGRPQSLSLDARHAAASLHSYSLLCVDGERAIDKRRTGEAQSILASAATADTSIFTRVSMARRRSSENYGCAPLRRRRKPSRPPCCGVAPLISKMRWRAKVCAPRSHARRKSGRSIRRVERRPPRNTRSKSPNSAIRRRSRSSPGDRPLSRHSCPRPDARACRSGMRPDARRARRRRAAHRISEAADHRGVRDRHRPRQAPELCRPR